MSSRTWPADWERRREGEYCPFCADGRPEESVGGLRVYAGPVSDAYLQRSAPAPGYTLVVWRGRHIADPSEMEAGEATTYWLEVLHVARGLTRVFDPCHLNYDVLGNAVPHVHTHLVPRYVNDGSPNMPLKPWDPVPVAADELRRQAARLRSVL